MSFVAVIDIGSNSIRIVIYNGINVNPLKILNEKVFCGLAKGMNKTKYLNKEGIEKAYAALERFTFLSQIHKVKSLFVFATSAVRDAIDGPSFIEEINKKYNINIDVLSPKKEAEYATYGIISSMFNPQGMVADLGGGSVEFISVENKSLKNIYSFPIGALRSSNCKDKNQLIEDTLSSFPVNKILKGYNLYAVGGAFRNLAKMYIKQQEYPLKIIHNYKISADDFYPFLDKISKLPKSVLQNNFPDISKKRIEVLPYAALMIKKIISKGEPENIIFSTHGVREGFIYSKLDEKQKSLDPLIVKCEDLAELVYIDNKYAYELLDWILNIFLEKTTVEKRILLAICMLSDVARGDMRSYRADLIYNKITDTNFISVNHKERVFIAKTLFFRYKGSLNKIKDECKLLLTPEEIMFSYRLGLSIRLANSLSNCCTNILKHTPVSVKNEELVLKFSKKYKLITGDIVEKRLNDLAETINCYPVIKIYKN